MKPVWMLCMMCIIVLLPACQGGEDAVVVGVMAPLTGDAAIYGEEIQKGIRLAYDLLGGTAGGRNIKIIWEDDKCSPQDGAIAANKLINVDDVDVILAASCSPPVLSAAPLAEESETIMVVPVATSPDLASFTSYVYKTAPLDTFQGADIARIVSEEGHGSVALLRAETAWASGVARVFEQEFEGEVAVEETFEQGQGDFRSSLLKVRGQNPDAIVILAYAFEYSGILRQMEELGMDVPVFAGDTFKDVQIIEAAGGAAEGVSFVAFPEFTALEAIQFRQAFQEKYGGPPGLYADYAYDGFMVVAQAVASAESSDPEDIAASLDGLRYVGATGVTQFDPMDKTVRSKRFASYVVVGGEFVALE